MATALRTAEQWARIHSYFPERLQSNRVQPLPTDLLFTFNFERFVPAVVVQIVPGDWSNGMWPMNSGEQTLIHEYG